MKNAIEINMLRKDFGRKCAVHDISLTVEEGIIFSLLGVNGAGKTTTIRMLTGLSKPSSGDALVYGKSILKDMEEIKQFSNLSPQETSIAPNLTVKENLEFIAQIYGIPKAERKQRVAAIVEQFDLGEVLSQKSGTLSGGWQRKVSIAMALITDPKVLYLDEPTLGLDVLSRRELWKVIRNLKGKMTIILTTHYMEEAEQLSDCVAVMVKGEVKAYGTVKQLEEQTGKTSLEEAFVAIAEEEVR